MRYGMQPLASDELLLNHANFYTARYFDNTQGAE